MPERFSALRAIDEAFRIPRTESEVFPIVFKHRSAVLAFDFEVGAAFFIDFNGHKSPFLGWRARTDLNGRPLP
jgi:hypothetical protein